MYFRYLIFWPLIAVATGSLLLNVGSQELAGPVGEVDAQFYDEALEYLGQFEGDLGLKVWPSSLRNFEIIGEELWPNVGEAIAVASLPFSRFEQVWFAPPQVSVFLYSDNSDTPLSDFMSESRMLGNYVSTVLELPMLDRECGFTYLETDDWLAGGALFMNVSVLRSEPNLRNCVSVGLDVINGLPFSPGLHYSQYPSATARRLILSEMSSCSRDGESSLEEPGFSRAGFSALPSMECVLARLGEGAMGS